MIPVALADAKNRLSELIDRVQQGEAFTITRRGKAVACLVLSDDGAAASQAQDAVNRLRELRESVDLKGLRASSLIQRGRR